MFYHTSVAFDKGLNGFDILVPEGRNRVKELENNYNHNAIGELVRLDFDLNHHRLAFMIVLSIGLPLLSYLAVADLFVGRYFIATVAFVMNISMVTVFLSARKSKGSQKEYKIYINFFRGFIILLLAYFIYAIGIKSNLSRIPWSYIFPVLAFFSLGRKEGAVWTSILLLVMAYLLFYTNFHKPIPETLLDLKSRYLMSILVVSVILYVAKHGFEKNEQALFDNQNKLKRSEESYQDAYKKLRDEISKNKRTESELAKSEEKYRNILEKMEEGYYETDIGGNFIFFNDSICKIFGYSWNELMKMNMRETTDQESAKSGYRAFNSVYTTGISHDFEWKVLRKDGKRRYVDASVSLMKNAEGHPIGFRGIIRDTTEHRRSQEALRESEEKFRTLAEDAPFGISIMKSDKTFEYLNVKFTEIFGYTIEDIPNKAAWFEKVYPDKEYSEKVVSVWKGDIVEDVKVGEIAPRVCTVRCKDGQDKIIHFLSVVLNDGKHFVTYEDITSQAMAEAEQQRLQAQLQQAQKMEAIGTLAGGVAHDLNNILSGLVSYPELLLMDLPEDSPLKNPILTIKKSGEKAAAIVQDMLTLARRGVAVTEVVNLNNIITEYLKSPEHKRLSLYHPNVQVETDLETNLLNISGSPVHLSKTIMNLVSNAAEAMPHGGSISISAKNQYIAKPIRGYDDVAEGDYVVFSISDTGIGISPEDMERIFEPFYTKKVMGRSGTGLGMAVVWGTIKDHKGYIDVQSTEGKGTTCRLYFPVAREEAVKGKSSISIEEYMGKEEAILIVNDVKEQREIASRMLKKLGYTVTVVSSGEEAVAYLKEHTVDLILLDMIMAPGIDGLETYKRILELHPRQKAIIASGFSETDRMKKAQRLGAGTYVKKPYVLEKIGIAVRDELDQPVFSKPPKTEKNNAMISA